MGQCKQVTVAGKTYNLGLQGQEQLERLFKGFQKNLAEGIPCELSFDGETEVCLMVSSPEGFCGAVRFAPEYGTIEEKGEEENVGSENRH